MLATPLTYVTYLLLISFTDRLPSSSILLNCRPTVISKLQPDSQGRQGVQGEEASKMLVEILEVGALSYLRSLQDNQDAEISFGDFQHEGESEDVESKSATKVDHWMREGERERAAVVLQATEALKEEAMKSSRALTLELVQLFPKLNVTLSDSLGSELISSFLVSDDVDSSLAILNILLSRGGHASNSACESLAKKLLSKGRHTMARAICRLIHVRGRLCDASFYSFLFASILAPTSQYATTSGAVAILNRSPQRLTSVRDDVRDIGMWLETNTAEGENLRDFQFGATSLDAVSAIDEALQVLSEVSAATYSATNGSPGHFESAPSNMNSKENRMRTISDSLVQIVLKFGYSNSQLERIYSAVAALRNSAKT